MSRFSSIEVHEERQAIDEALINRVPYRDIAEQYDVSITALSRYKNEKLPKKLVKAKAAEEVADADELINRVRGLQDEAAAILKKSKEDDDNRTALLAIRESRSCLELLAKMLGELRTGRTTIIQNQYVDARTVIMAALAPYPEARQAVAEALTEKA